MAYPVGGANYKHKGHQRLDYWQHLPTGIYAPIEVLKWMSGNVGYPWPLSQGLWVRRHQKMPKVSTEFYQKQDTEAMSKFALARRSPFYDVWPHSFSCWIAGEKINTKKSLRGYFYLRLSSVSSKRILCQVIGGCHTFFKFRMPRHYTQILSQVCVCAN